METVNKQVITAKPDRSTERRKSHFKPPVKRLMLPSIIFVALVTQIPFLITLYFSLHQWNLMRPDLGRAFAGFANYKQLLTSASTWSVIQNTFVLTVGALLLCLMMGMAFALLLNRNFFAKGLVRTMLITPFFIMPTVTGVIWKNMILDPNFGFLAYLSQQLGAGPVEWLTHHPLLTIMMMIAWQWTPFFLLVLLAGLQSVPEDAIEASMLDGAGKAGQFIHVTLPHLLRYIEVASLLGIIFIMQEFGLIYVTTSGGPGYASTNLTFQVYRTGFQGWDIGGASAVGVIIVVLSVLMMTLLFKFLRRTFQGELS
ncbi:carbohydrate ABC transporter permease [Paenibacillus abyssi]|uniref:Sugar ABC transporter permease n=1 Tax=Paenibacillus abyssi TaxID=1340531 RepID=A0A917LES9_9BACL|nr:sugar ABC transporter permease [Paenibacillus abyssi]GGG15976.1 sugar ABC transporter permease [Paenibacillus abyssi]